MIARLTRAHHTVYSNSTVETNFRLYLSTCSDPPSSHRPLVVSLLQQFLSINDLEHYALMQGFHGFPIGWDKCPRCGPFRLTVVEGNLLVYGEKCKAVRTDLDRQLRLMQ